METGSNVVGLVLFFNFLKYLSFFCALGVVATLGDASCQDGTLTSHALRSDWLNKGQQPVSDFTHHCDLHLKDPPYAPSTKRRGPGPFSLALSL